MHFQSIALKAAVQAPGKGNHMSAGFRVGDVGQGPSHSHLHAIYEKGAWLVLVSKKGESRLITRESVRDAEEEDDDTKAYREDEAVRMKARAKAQKEE